MHRPGGGVKGRRINQALGTGGAHVCRLLGKAHVKADADAESPAQGGKGRAARPRGEHIRLLKVLSTGHINIKQVALPVKSQEGTAFIINKAGVVNAVLGIFFGNRPANNHHARLPGHLAQEGAAGPLSILGVVGKNSRIIGCIPHFRQYRQLSPLCRCLTQGGLSPLQISRLICNDRHLNQSNFKCIHTDPPSFLDPLLT